MDIEALKAAIRERWGAYAPGSLALEIVDFIARLPRAELQMLTLPTFAKALRRDIDVDLIAAVNILTHSSLAILESKALFVDDEDNEFPVDDEELAEANQTGELVHPETGAMVADYEKHIVPFFVPVERFFAE